VCYVYFEDYSIVRLLILYAKNERDDLSAADKKALRCLIEEAKRELSRRQTLK
jgi:hypothetical protein